MISQEKIIEDRKVYAKPQLERVRLIPRESVLAVCKTATEGGGSTGLNCVAAGCQEDNATS